MNHSVPGRFAPARRAGGAAALFLATLMPLGHAALISADFQHPGDGLITRDSQSGLDWLDVTQTYSRLASDAPFLTGTGGSFAGFRLANAAEFDLLYLHAGLAFSFGENSPFATDPAYMARARDLQNLMGFSLPFPSPNLEVRATAGFLGGGGRNFGLIGVYDFAPGQGTDYYRAESYTVNAPALSYVGLYLVRASPPPASNVPEGGTVLAMLSGSLLLIGAGRLRG
jgi:hypothetical protein